MTKFESTGNSRRSGFELLRILAMVFILVVHVDGASLGFPDFRTVWSSGDWWRMAFEAMAITGVNLFVLISGYFTIRLTSRRLVNYLIMCAFYAWGIFAVHCFAVPGYFTMAHALRALAVFSHSDLWFVRDYLFLMLLAPLLNGGLDALRRIPAHLIGVVASLIVINCWFGWWQSGQVNPAGYNLMQMIMMYVLGYFMRCLSIEKFPWWASASLWLASTAAIVWMSASMPPTRAFAYNQPMVIAASCALFALFARLKFSFGVVNWVASSTFAVYLIHKDPYVWVAVVKPMVLNMAASSSGMLFFARCAAFVAAVFVACVVIDKLCHLLHIRW